MEFSDIRAIISYAYNLRKGNCFETTSNGIYIYIYSRKKKRGVKGSLKKRGKRKNDFIRQSFALSRFSKTTRSLRVSRFKARYTFAIPADSTIRYSWKRIDGILAHEENRVNSISFYYRE